MNELEIEKIRQQYVEYCHSIGLTDEEHIHLIRPSPIVLDFILSFGNKRFNEGVQASADICKPDYGYNPLAYPFAIKPDILNLKIKE
jgi:hypothetical protein